MGHSRATFVSSWESLAYTDNVPTINKGYLYLFSFTGGTQVKSSCQSMAGIWCVGNGSI